MHSQLLHVGMCVYSHQGTRSSFHMTSASLDRSGFVPAESVMKFRKQLGCKSFATEEKGITCQIAVIYFFDVELHVFHLWIRGNITLITKIFYLLFPSDPEEFITLLLKDVLHIEPLLKIRSVSFALQICLFKKHYSFLTFYCILHNP